MNDILDILDGLTVGLATMAVCALIVYVAPAVIYHTIAGLYQFWQMVGWM